VGDGAALSKQSGLSGSVRRVVREFVEAIGEVIRTNAAGNPGLERLLGDGVGHGARDVADSIEARVERALS
jgi:hypothetical protein